MGCWHVTAGSEFGALAGIYSLTFWSDFWLFAVVWKEAEWRWFYASRKLLYFSCVPCKRYDVLLVETDPEYLQGLGGPRGMLHVTSCSVPTPARGVGSVTGRN